MALQDPVAADSLSQLTSRGKGGAPWETTPRSRDAGFVKYGAVVARPL